MIILSLFVAVILEGFDKSERDEKSLVKPYQIDNFQAVWGRVDPKGIGYIQTSSIYKILENL